MIYIIVCIITVTAVWYLRGDDHTNADNMDHWTYRYSKYPTFVSKILKNHQYYSVVSNRIVYQLIDCTNMVWIDGARLADHRRGHIVGSSFFNRRAITFLLIYTSTSTNWSLWWRYSDSTVNLVSILVGRVLIWTILFFGKMTNNRKINKKNKKSLTSFFLLFLPFLELMSFRRAVRRAFVMGSHCWSMFFLFFFCFFCFFAVVAMLRHEAF